MRKASVRSRRADEDDEAFDRPAASRPWWWRLLLRRPLDTLAFLALAGAASAIVVNGIYLQHGRHPAPIFAEHSLPVAAAPSAPSHRLRATDLQPAHRDVVDLPRPRPAAAPAAPARKDPIAELLAENPAPAQPHAAAAPPRPTAPPAQPRPAATRSVAGPSRHVLAIQHALSDFGYGQLSPTGIYDAETRAAVQRFEKARNLPITGEITEAVRRELAAVTGRNLD